MTNQPLYEIVVFKAKDGISAEQVVSAAQHIQPLLDSYKGYISRQLVQADGDQWVDIVTWESLEDAKFAANDIMSKPIAAIFMNVIDTETINMMHGTAAFVAQLTD